MNSAFKNNGDKLPQINFYFIKFSYNDQTQGAILTNVIYLFNGYYF